MDDHDVDDSQFPDGEEFVPYVNGVSIKNRSVDGRRVRLWGKVRPGGVAGGKISLITADEAEVTIQLQCQASVPEHPSQWVEAIGVARGGVFVVDQLLTFPIEICSDVDIASHRALAIFLDTMDNPWNLGENE